MPPVGDGTFFYRETPVLLSSDSWLDVSVGLAPQSRRTGDSSDVNWSYQEGDVSSAPRHFTQPTAGTYVLAVKSDGSLWGWGSNYHAVLGNGKSTPESKQTFLRFRGLLSSSITHAEVLPDYNGSGPADPVLWDSVGYGADVYAPLIVGAVRDDENAQPGSFTASPNQSAVLRANVEIFFKLSAFADIPSQPIQSSGGSGYAAVPLLTVYAVDSQGQEVALDARTKQASLTADMRFTVASVAVSGQTQPYRGDVAVVFPRGVDGNTAVAECTLVNGVVTAITVTSPGLYSEVPTATIYGTGGNATATVTASGTIVGVKCESEGRYFDRRDRLRMRATGTLLPGGSHATFSSLTPWLTGRYTGITIENGGSGYTCSDTIRLGVDADYYFNTQGITTNASYSPQWRFGGVDLRHPSRIGGVSTSNAFHAKGFLSPSGVASVSSPQVVDLSGHNPVAVPAGTFVGYASTIDLGISSTWYLKWDGHPEKIPLNVTANRRLTTSQPIADLYGKGMPFIYGEVHQSYRSGDGTQQVQVPGLMFYDSGVTYSGQSSAYRMLGSIWGGTPVLFEDGVTPPNTTIVKTTNIPPYVVSWPYSTQKNVRVNSQIERQPFEMYLRGGETQGQKATFALSVENLSASADRFTVSVTSPGSGYTTEPEIVVTDVLPSPTLIDNSRQYQAVIAARNGNETTTASAADAITACFSMALSGGKVYEWGLQSQTGTPTPTLRGYHLEIKATNVPVLFSQGYMNGGQSTPYTGLGWWLSSVYCNRQVPCNNSQVYRRSGGNVGYVTGTYGEVDYLNYTEHWNYHADAFIDPASVKKVLSNPYYSGATPGRRFFAGSLSAVVQSREDVFDYGSVAIFTVRAPGWVTVPTLPQTPEPCEAYLLKPSEPVQSLVRQDDGTVLATGSDGVAWVLDSVEDRYNSATAGFNSSNLPSANSEFLGGKFFANERGQNVFSMLPPHQVTGKSTSWSYTIGPAPNYDVSISREVIDLPPGYGGGYYAIPPRQEGGGAITIPRYINALLLPRNTTADPYALGTPEFSLSGGTVASAVRFVRREPVGSTGLRVQQTSVTTYTPTTRTSTVHYFDGRVSDLAFDFAIPNNPAPAPDGFPGPLYPETGSSLASYGLSGETASVASYYTSLPTISLTCGGQTAASEWMLYTFRARLYSCRKVPLMHPSCEYTESRFVQRKSGTNNYFVTNGVHPLRRQFVSLPFTRVFGSLFAAGDNHLANWRITNARSEPLPTYVPNLEIDVTDGGEGFTEIPDVVPSHQPDGVASVTAVLDGKVTTVCVEKPGSGYSSPPSVTISGGGGSGAEAVATIEGPVGECKVTSPGSGYTSPPYVTFSGTGFAASGSATVSLAGAVESISVSDGGKYRTAPVITIVPQKRVSSVSLDSGGSDYTSPPSVTLCATESGSGAACKTTIDGKVVKLILTSGGSGYTSDDVTIKITSQGALGSGASATPVIDEETGAITSLSIDSGGSMYQSPPSVSITSLQGSGAVAVAQIAGPVASVSVTQGGSGYILPPAVRFQGGGGSGATATATLADIGSGATATAALNAGVSYITVTKSGGGYQHAPSVRVSGGGNKAGDESLGKLSSGEITLAQYNATPSVTVAQARVDGMLRGASVTTPFAGEEDPFVVNSAGSRYASGVITRDNAGGRVPARNFAYVGGFTRQQTDSYNYYNPDTATLWQSSDLWRDVQGMYVLQSRTDAGVFTAPAWPSGGPLAFDTPNRSTLLTSRSFTKNRFYRRPGMMFDNGHGFYVNEIEGVRTVGLCPRIPIVVPFQTRTHTVFPTALAMRAGRSTGTNQQMFGYAHPSSGASLHYTGAGAQVSWLTENCEWLALDDIQGKAIKLPVLLGQIPNASLAIFMPEGLRLSDVRFSEPPAFSLVDVVGTGASLQAAIDQSGFITSLSFTAQGSGYTDRTVLRMNSCSVRKVPASASCVVDQQGRVSHCIVTNPGDGFVSPIAIVHDGGGSGCTVSVSRLFGGSAPCGIAAIRVDNGGSGYSQQSPPSVYIYDAVDVDKKILGEFNAAAKSFPLYSPPSSRSFQYHSSVYPTDESPYDDFKTFATFSEATVMRTYPSNGQEMVRWYPWFLNNRQTTVPAPWNSGIISKNYRAMWGGSGNDQPVYVGPSSTLLRQRYETLESASMFNHRLGLGPILFFRYNNQPGDYYMQVFDVFARFDRIHSITHVSKMHPSTFDTSGLGAGVPYNSPPTLSFFGAERSKEPTATVTMLSVDPQSVSADRTFRGNWKIRYFAGKK